ncbi:hypothetical protein QTP70_024625 [Hemibagrus guttatus]|uniref:Integrase p58-like C-terminal domain-containing protein n=1 Tax=Hemibagrus guttatus TaxID=175788 RepID=A0AAE0Q9I7_9TELE|nr:hypothetical protein QTP70_024625 [Hemibagrus guttatus]
MALNSSPSDRRTQQRLKADHHATTEALPRSWTNATCLLPPGLSSSPGEDHDCRLPDTPSGKTSLTCYSGGGYGRWMQDRHPGSASRNIVRELLMLFSHVGIPKDILTDQGMPFISRLIVDLSAFTGFTPFELLFGQQPLGLLDVAHEAWERQHLLFHSVIDYVQDMQARIDRVGPIIKEHIKAPQRNLQRTYKQPAQPWTFHDGDQIMLLVPNTACKFLAKCQGPYTVLEWVGPVNYWLQQPSKHADTQLYHINILKKWLLAQLAVSMFASAATDPQESALVRRGEELSPTQQQDLKELIDQLSDVFLSTPGLPQLVQHEIKTPPGMVVRNRVPEAHRQAIEQEVE